MAIFVFGSNESGIHGAGASLYARKVHGAKLGQGFGRSGNSFAIPTTDWKVDTLPIPVIAFYVKRFFDYAYFNPEIFHLTKIGCGLAGHKESDIAQLFVKAPQNVKLIDEQQNVICLASEWYGNSL